MSNNSPVGQPVDEFLRDNHRTHFSNQVSNAIRELNALLKHGRDHLHAITDLRIKNDGDEFDVLISFNPEDQP